VARELDLRHDVSDVAGFGEAGAAFTPQTTCALISYSPEAAMAWRNALGPFHIGRLIIGSRADAVVQRPDGTPPDAFVISADLASKGEGLRLLSELRSASGTRNAAIIIAVEDGDINCAALALDMGANDVITMPFAAEELALRLQKHLTHKHRADQLRDNVARGLRLASVDPLTGLYNRRYALPCLDRIAHEAQVNATPYAVMVLDMDRFKRINDQFGHFVGDQVLAHVAKTLRLNLRPEDLIGRLGGEEFLVALPGATPTQANVVATRLCEAVRTTPVTLSDGPANALFVSISIGLATSARGHHAAKEMMQEADLALYEAKAAGRNTISTHSFAA
jgi:two-component system cell cycle response regulator